jgi:tetratricopeptide (TPR) repeat protein
LSTAGDADGSSLISGDVGGTRSIDERSGSLRPSDERSGSLRSNDDLFGAARRIDDREVNSSPSDEPTAGTRRSDNHDVTVRPEAAASSGEALQAWLALLPSLVLVWPGPGALLRNDFIPQSTGAGAVALLSLPAAILLVLRRAAPAVRGLTLFLVPMLIGVGWVSFGAVDDTFEASRVLLVAFTALAMLISGASLGERGRRILARGAVCIALVLLVPAHLDRANGWTGVLGNTGSVSEATLAGAVVGGMIAARGSTAWRSAWGFLGAGALLLHVAYTARMPVIAGALALAAAFAAAAWFAPRFERATRIAFTAFACSAVLGIALPIARARNAAAATASEPTARESAISETGGSESKSRRESGGGESNSSSEPSARESSAVPSSAAIDPGNTGGIEVRARIWAASLSMLRDHALFGVGPGQFTARFPAYRDPREIELSTLGRRLDAETEVEHPHNDWLAVALDTGVLGGLCWIGFLAGVIAAGFRALSSGTGELSGLAAAAVALAANAFVNATLSSDAVSSSLAFAIFGCVLGQAGAPRTILVRRFVALCAAALLVLQAPRAWAFVRHGRALHPLAAGDDLDTDVQKHALDAALDACPDSVLALRLHARLLEGLHGDASTIHADWLRVLDARPHHIEALMQIGLLAARAGEPEQARPYFLDALKTDRDHPGVLQDLAVLELEDGNLESGLDYLDRLSRIRPPSVAWISDLACRLYLRGEEREYDAVMQRADPTLVHLNAERAYALSKEARTQQHALLADALESQAQRAWARDHMRNGRYKDAVRIYRQDLRITRDYVEGGAPRLRLELAAALLASGREDEAKSEAGELHPKPRDWEVLPDFAATRLHATGWYGN